MTIENTINFHKIQESQLNFTLHRSVNQISKTATLQLLCTAQKRNVLQVKLVSKNKKFIVCNCNHETIHDANQTLRYGAQENCPVICLEILLSIFLKKRWYRRLSLQ